MQRVGGLHNCRNFNGIFPIFNGCFNGFSNGRPRLSFRRLTEVTGNIDQRRKRNVSFNYR